MVRGAISRARLEPFSSPTGAVLELGGHGRIVRLDDVQPFEIERLRNVRGGGFRTPPRRPRRGPCRRESVAPSAVGPLHCERSSASIGTRLPGRDHRMGRGRFGAVPGHDGHTALEVKKVKEGTSGFFEMCLTYNVLDADRAAVVAHVWSASWDASPYIQRGTVGGGNRRPSFLERLGFQEFHPCPHMNTRRCLHATIGRADRHDLDSTHPLYQRFDVLLGKLEDIYRTMRSLDQMLLDVGFDLPYDDIRPAALQDSSTKIYDKGEQYDV